MGFAFVPLWLQPHLPPVPPRVTSIITWCSSKTCQPWVPGGLTPALSILSISLQFQSLRPLWQEKEKTANLWAVTGTWVGGTDAIITSRLFSKGVPGGNDFRQPAWISQSQLVGPVYPIIKLQSHPGQKAMNMEIQSQVPSGSLRSVDVPRREEKLLEVSG